MIAGPSTNVDVNDENGPKNPGTEEISSVTGHVVDPEPPKVNNPPLRTDNNSNAPNPAEVTNNDLPNDSPETEDTTEETSRGRDHVVNTEFVKDLKENVSLVEYSDSDSEESDIEDVIEKVTKKPSLAGQICCRGTKSLFVRNIVAIQVNL